MNTELTPQSRKKAHLRGALKSAQPAYALYLMELECYYRRMLNRCHACTLFIFLLVSISHASQAADLSPTTQHNANSTTTSTTPTKKEAFIIPYPYYNANTEATAGLVIGASGYFQPQVSAFANFIYSSNDSKIAYVQIDNVQMVHRLFVDTKLLIGHWGGIDFYPNRSNDSSKNDFTKISADDQWYRLNLRYLLPIGDGKSSIVHHYQVNDGILNPQTASGGTRWNPFTSGRTYLEIEPFYRAEDLKGIGNFVTSGINTGINYDNRDWPVNPSKGSHMQLHYQHDWGNLDDSVSWSAWVFEYAHYWSLGSSDTFKQRVIAMDLWTFNIPTWNNAASVNSSGDTTFHRPPPFAGDTLGGWDHFRGYPTNRFEDKAAINHQLEYRVMPRWNPFPAIPLLKALHIPWWQWATFVELGRVAPQWSLVKLHQDMRWNAGAGIRAFVNGILVRIDLAGSKEGMEIQMIIDQAF